MLALSMVMLSACTTEDVYPTLSLESSRQSLDAETVDTLEIRVRLNGAVNRQIVLPLLFSGSAVLNQDYQVTATDLVIDAGKESGKITLSSIPTGSITDKTIIVRIAEVEKTLLTAPASVTIELVSCLADRDGDGVSDCDDLCPDLAGPAANDGCPWLGLLINEVHYDPAADLPGDANGDGVRDPLADEFVELYNSNAELDISGYTLSDASMLRHTFPVGTVIPSKGVVVVFGGGTPTGTFGGALVQTASGGQLNLNNAGDVLTLRNAAGVTLAVFDINGLSGNPDEAYTRNPDITGEFVQHSAIPAAAGALYSPGRKVDGSNF